MKVTFKEGKTAKLTGINQTITYAGLLEGYPNKSLNDSIIKSAIEDAAIPFFYQRRDVATTVITPEIQVEEVEIETFPFNGKNKVKKQVESLPRYKTVLMVDDYDRYGFIILFSNDFFNYELIKDKLSELNWKEVTQEYSW